MSKKSKYISLFLLLSLVLSLFAPAACAAGGGRLVVSEASGKAGEIVEITVSLENNPGIISVTMEIGYDASRLRLVEATDEKLLNDSIFSDSYSKNPYYLSWNDALALENTTADGVLATLRFEILSGAAAGKTAITLTFSENEVFDAELNNVPFIAQNGAVIIESSAEEGDGSAGGGGGGGGGGGSSGGGSSDSEEKEDNDDTHESSEPAVSGAELYKAYTDLASDGWYREAVEYMLEMGYMNGMSDTIFQPNGTITRAQLVTILYRIEGSPAISASSNPFADVEANAWYGSAVIWAASKGVVNGVADDRFAPNNAITREQLAAVLYRYSAAYRDTADNLADFKDAASISSYALEAINWAVGAGIMNGVADDTLAPSGTATRAQTAAMLYRYIRAFTAIPVPGTPGAVQ